MATNSTFPHTAFRAATILGGLLLKPLVASEVLAESDLEDDQDALLFVEGVLVRCRGVRYSSSVDKVGGGAVFLPE
jgi:hypothetical protein